MPRETTEGFVETKNAQTNEPILLYRVNISDTPEASGEADLFLTSDPFPVEYFRTDDGTDTPQTYEPFPIKHSGVGSNTDGRIDSVSLTISNVSQEIEAFLQNRDGLRGRLVTIRQVFRDQLDDPEAYVEDVFAVDSVRSNARSAVFRLSSKLDVLNIRIPRRTYMRNYCPWEYKGLGCWKEQEDGDFDSPDDFSIGDYFVHSSEASGAGTTPAVAIAQARFHELNIRGFNQDFDKLIISLKLSDRSKFVGQTGAIELTSSGGPDAQELQYNVDLSTLVPDNNYHTVTLDLSLFTALTGTFNPAKLNFIRVFGFPSSGSATIYWKDAKVRTQRGDSCNKRLADCRRHNNVKRFGGFPGIPDRRTFRG